VKEVQVHGVKHKLLVKTNVLNSAVLKQLNSVHFLALMAYVLHHAPVLLPRMSAAENTENTGM
jgi:hypothetical protein